MMLRIGYILVWAFSLMLMVSCDDDKGDLRRSLVLTSNSPVKTGEELRVSVVDYFDDLFYHITTPDGITGNTSSFENTATPYTAGYYHITASNEKYNLRDSIYVEVIPRPVPCLHALNELSSSLSSSLNLSFYGSGGRQSSDDYIVSASAIGGDLDLTFSEIQGQPKIGTYVSKPRGGFNQPGEVSLYINYGGVVMFGLKNQDVHVFEENGKRVVSLCDFKFTSGTFGEVEVSTTVEL